jgi:hypothetical protein
MDSTLDVTKKNYKNKYLKYKNKYLLGGNPAAEEVEDKFSQRILNRIEKEREQLLRNRNFENINVICTESKCQISFYHKIQKRIIKLVLSPKYPIIPPLVFIENSDGISYQVVWEDYNIVWNVALFLDYHLEKLFESPSYISSFPNL